MNFTRLSIAALGIFLIGSGGAFAAERPNILLILADDLGFSDLGCYGGEIETPNLDGLAEGGLRFTQFYNTARCWPTRASLMTGYYAQQVGRDQIPGIRQTGNRGARPGWAPLLPVLLKENGYRSYHIGKWHIDGMPVEQGFDRSYYLKDQGRFFNPTKHWLDDRALPAVEKDSGFYATTALADHAIDFLKEHAREHGGRPFFQYLAFAAPHFPLHALPEDIAKYEKSYLGGWEEIRQNRYQKIGQLGLVVPGLSAVERDLGPPYDFPDALELLGGGEVNRPARWADLTPVQQAFQAKKMAIHAAMIDRMDQEIGRVLGQIEKMGQLENTLILFLSDNGASAEIMVRDDGHDPEAPPGSAATYLCLGPGWSTTSNTPFRRHKTWTHEGGIATPLIVTWPAGIAGRGELRKTPAHVVDVVPTLLALAGLDDAEKIGDLEVPPKPGRDLRPAFGEERTIGRDSIWWYHDGHRAIRVGDWKLVAAKGQPWELYDLSRDRAEGKDLSADHPDRVQAMEAEWDRQLEQSRKLVTRPSP
ncbi:MAG: arylsulfatase [Verrucomicrobiales bacterium]